MVGPRYFAAQQIGDGADSPRRGGGDHRSMRVDEIMTREVVSVPPEMSLKDVARVLAARGISGVPVCDAMGAVLGVVTEADILRKEEGVDPELGRTLTWLVTRLDDELSKVGARTAADAMTSPALTVRPGQSTADAARLMVDRRINRVPVVADGKLVGIVSRADLVRAFTRSDEEVEREIREDVLLRVMLLNPRGFGVYVHDGSVSLCGEVASRDDARMLVRCVRRVPGVVDVRAHHVRWPRATSARAPLAVTPGHPSLPL
jgi:CBS domain-containing protein